VHSLLDGSHVLEGAGAYVDALELLDEAREVCVRHAMSAALPGVLGARAGVLAHAGRPDELRVALAELEELTIGTSGGAG
jgi:hypothetical protein